MKKKIVRLNVENQSLLKKCARLYCKIWKEPPWNEHFWKVKRVIRDIHKDMARLNATGFLVLAKSKFTRTNKVIGFTWGYEVFKKDLREISGINILEFLFESKKRVFYVDELGVHSSYRKCGIGKKLSRCLISTTRYNGIRYFSLRTDIKAIAAKNLYSKLGFNDLHIRDDEYSQRTYWLLELP